MDEVLHGHLIELAKVTTYSDVALLRDLDVRADIAELSHRLDEISKYEHENGRPLLSVLVTHKDGDRAPGDGFFKLARNLGVQRREADNLTFFAQELQRCHDYWRGRRG